MEKEGKYLTCLPFFMNEIKLQMLCFTWEYL